MTSFSTSIIARTLMFFGAVLSFGTAAPDAFSQSSASYAAPIRELSNAIVAPHTFASLFGVREIANRRILVNDAIRRQLLLLDDRLAVSRVVLDSISDSGREGYGADAAPLIPYLADSTFFVDRAARALLVITPNGSVARSTAVPLSSRAFSWLMASPSRADGHGNLLIREITNSAIKTLPATSTNAIVEESKLPDSTFLLRANFESRKVDTIAALKQMGQLRSIRTRPPNAQSSLRILVSPIETLDDWTTLSDGTVAVVRGGDYHVDFLRNDGTWKKGGKLPIEWKALTQADKERIVDSTRAYIDSVTRAAVATGGERAAAVAQRDAILGAVVTLPGAAPAAVAAPPVAAAANGPVPPRIPYDFVPFDQMPSYVPPLRAGYSQGDADGNLWILPTTSSLSKFGELVYDVVDSEGVLKERVRIPLGRTVVAFGVGGVVYLSHRESTGAWRLERRNVLR